MEAEVRAAFAIAHAAMARAIAVLAAFDAGGAWRVEEYRDCEHWLSVHCGIGRAMAAEIVRVARALPQLPTIAGAFHDGSLSLDKVRALTQVALPEDEAQWLDLGLALSAPQLMRVCREFRRAYEADAVSQGQHARRGLWHRWRQDGMLELAALLAPDDGAALLAALERVLDERRFDPLAAEDSAAARRADALLDLVAGAAEPGQLIVHVDADVLAGGDGRCHSDSGTPLPTSVAQQLACDCSRVTVLEREGLPIDVGRARRTIPPATRRALVVRDRTCTFPGCLAPARRSPGHHVRPWALGGPTDLDNLASLCGYHHRRLHRGAFRIVAEGRRRFRFELPDGRPVMPLAEPATDAPPRATGDPFALAGGVRLDLDWTMTVLCGNRDLLLQGDRRWPPRASPQPG